MYDTPLTIVEVMGALTTQPEAIAALTAGLPRARLHSAPSTDAWSLNDVLAHLRSCADMWGKYIALIVTEDHPTFRAMNPTKWIESTDYPRLDFQASFRSYRKQRAELISFMQALPESAWLRSATVTGAGSPRDRTVLEYARWLANHERSHMRQIRRLAGG